MPSTVVHVALGGLVGAAVLGERFDRRALAVVLVASAVPDLDTFLGIAIEGGHRSLLHTLLLPGLAAAALLVDERGSGFVRGRWGDRGVALAWAAVAALAFGGIGPDLFTNGVNAFYPVHDRFYALNGKVLLSNQRGVVQTFVELGGDAGGGGGGDAAVGTTETTHYSTGVDPTAGEAPESVERVFPVVRSGMQLLLVFASSVVVTARLWENR